MTWLTWIATAAAGLFSGAALYISLVEHPARVGCGPMMAVAQFRLSYPRAARLQAPLAALAALAGIGTGVGGGGLAWLAAGLLLGAVVPYTLVGIMPTNERLLDRGLEPDTPEAERLLRRWGHLHLGRTAASLVAFGWMLRLLLAR